MELSKAIIKAYVLLTSCLLAGGVVAAAVHAGAVCCDAQLPALGKPAERVWRKRVRGELGVDPAVWPQGAPPVCRCWAAYSIR